MQVQQDGVVRAAARRGVEAAHEVAVEAARELLPRGLAEGGTEPVVAPTAVRVDRAGLAAACGPLHELGLSRVHVAVATHVWRQRHGVQPDVGVQVGRGAVQPGRRRLRRRGRRRPQRRRLFNAPSLKGRRADLNVARPRARDRHPLCVGLRPVPQLVPAIPPRRDEDERVVEQHHPVERQHARRQVRRESGVRPRLALVRLVPTIVRERG